MKTFLIFGLLLMLITADVFAYAVGDGNLTIGSCSNHPTGGRATIYFNPNIPLTANVNQEIHISVILKLGPTTNRLAGIMLVNGVGGHPSADGWIIRQDPNGNTTPYNYNEKSNLPDSVEFLWILRAPSTAGTRRFRAKLYYGDNGAKSKEATPIDIQVIPVGIIENEVINQSKLKILIPTIVKTNLALETNEKQSEGYIKIYNTLGKSVLPRIPIPTNSRFTIDLQTLSPGIYFVGLFRENNVILQKFIKID